MKTFRKYGIFALTATLAVPAIVSAQGITELITTVNGIIGALIPFIIGLAVLLFIWGVLMYVVAKDDAKQSEARGVMLWGIIAIFVMVSVWGLVNLLVETVDLENDAATVPVLPTSN